MWPFPNKIHEPTGRVRHRVGYGKRLVMQIEIRKTKEHANKPNDVTTYWRDARTEDLAYTQVMRHMERDGLK